MGGKRVGIVGMGRIGLDVAKRLNAFGCIISYTSRNKKPHVTFPFFHIQKLAANCEIFVIFCALTDQTRHMINKRVMLALGNGGIVVNVARGAIVNEKTQQITVRGVIASKKIPVHVSHLVITTS